MQSKQQDFYCRQQLTCLLVLCAIECARLRDYRRSWHTHSAQTNKDNHKEEEEGGKVAVSKDLISSERSIHALTHFVAVPAALKPSSSESTMVK